MNWLLALFIFLILIGIVYLSYQLGSSNKELKNIDKDLKNVAKEQANANKFIDNLRNMSYADKRKRLQDIKRKQRNGL